MIYLDVSFLFRNQSLNTLLTLINKLNFYYGFFVKIFVIMNHITKQNDINYSKQGGLVLWLY